MARKVPPEVELKWQDGSFRAVGNLPLILVAVLITVLGIAYLALTNWDQLLG